MIGHDVLILSKIENSKILNRISVIATLCISKNNKYFKSTGGDVYLKKQIKNPINFYPDEHL